MVVGILVALSALALIYAVALVREAIRRGQVRPRLEAVALGAVVDFFDTLGIGSFAPTTAWLKLRRMIPDSFLPATLNAGHCLPTVTQALIFINLVQVDVWLLVGCIAAAVLGGVMGAPVVQRLPVRAVQAIVGLALLVAAGLYAMTNLGLMPGGGEALGLSGPGFWIAIVAHLILGTLMAFGVGLYAPSLILLSLLGLNPIAAFPIMMGACGFLMPVTSLSFIRSERIDLRVVIGLALGGIPAVLLAAFVVKSLDVATLRWGVVVVVLYAAAALLWSAARPRPVTAT
jgi:uncharacterized membrane protein YfcA